jgi:uncharacterized SAM-binding protein YcdF (DUF218 family)
MFILKKLITPFIIPPGCFIIVLLLSGIWLRNRKQRGASINIVLALLLWAASVAPVSDALIGRLEAGLTIPQHAQGDVIILLGGGINDGVADLTGRGTPSDDMMTRMVTAVRLYHRFHIPIIVSGGSGYAGRAPEAPVIRRFLVDLGVKESHILLEPRSRDTRENARFCREIVRQHGFQHPLLVTSAYHMRRSVREFQKAGLAVAPIPSQFETGSGKQYIWADFLPDARDLLNSAKALREYFGLLFSAVMQKPFFR